MRTAPVKAIALPTVYRVSIARAFPAFAHVRYGFAHTWTLRVLHFSAFITGRLSPGRTEGEGCVCVCVCVCMCVCM